MGIKHSLETVKRMLNESGYALLSSEYSGIHNKIIVLCSNRHEWATTLSDIYHGGQKCPRCQGIRRFTTAEVIGIFYENGYTAHLLEYKNAREKIQTTCPKGHSWSVAYFKFLSGKRCSKCSRRRKFTFEEVKKRVENDGYKLISSEYVEANSKLAVLCPKGHTVSITFWEFRKRECSCPECHPQSIPELRLFEEIKKVYPTAKPLRKRKIAIKDKPYIHGFDIDIYVPELNRGIEFDGERWHSFEIMRKSKNKKKWSDDDIHNYHQIKDDYFHSIGINILHIKEQEWKMDSIKCIAKCLDFLKSG